MQKKDVVYILDTLKDWYPDNKTELVYTTPFQLLISVIMSAQTTDKQVNKVTADLYCIVSSPEDVVTMGLEELTQRLSSLNLYRGKAKNVFLLSQKISQDTYKKDFLKKYSHGLERDIYDQYGYIIPSAIADLMQLPGVGEKTAKVVSHCLYQTPVVAVDTHVHRVANRLGLVRTTAPLQTSQLLENIIPKQYKSVAHHALIFFGRYHCTARKPKCQSCPFTQLCHYYKTVVSKQ